MKYLKKDQTTFSLRASSLQQYLWIAERSGFRVQGLRYHDSWKLVANFEVNGPNAETEHDVDDKAQPVVTHVSGHVHVGAPHEGETLSEEARLTATRFLDFALLYKH